MRTSVTPARLVTPAKAGVHTLLGKITAFAGMTIVATTILLLFPCLIFANTPTLPEEASAWHRQITGAQWVKLSEGQLSFEGLFAESVAKSTAGAVIVIPGQGMSPDWQYVIRPLRKSLPQMGWSVLVLSLPEVKQPELATVSEVEAGGPPSAGGSLSTEGEQALTYAKSIQKRLDIAMDWLKKQGYGTVLLLGYQDGGVMAAYGIQQNSAASQADGLVLLSAYLPGRSSTEKDMVSNIVTTHQPVLDLYAERDLRDVLESVHYRRVDRRRAGHRYYWIRMISASGPDYLYASDKILKNIRGWLVKNAQGFKLQKKAKQLAGGAVGATTGGA